MVDKKKINLTRYFVFLSIVFVFLPIHITFDANLNIYFNRVAGWYYDGFYLSIPVGTFWLLIGFFYLFIFRPLDVIIPCLILFSYFGFLFLFDALNFRHIANVAALLYFFLCIRLFQLFAKQRKLSELNGWKIYSIWILFVLVIHFFPEFFVFNIYDFDQYIATFISSLVIGIFFLKNLNILSKVFLSIIFYLLMKLTLYRAFSTYVDGSLLIAVMFFGLYFVLKSFKLKTSLVFHSMFWLINFLYITFLYLPYDFTFKNQRETIFVNFFKYPESLISPIFKNEMSNFYSLHSFLLECFRTFGVFSILVLFFMLRSIINPSNSAGSIMANHAFIVIGLFSMPQLHFYTIPLIAMLPLLNWSTLPFFRRY